MPPQRLFTRPFLLCFAANLVQGIAFNLFLHFPGFLKQLGSNDAIMGTPIFGQEQMARAVEVGLGVSGPEEIDLVSDDAEGMAYAQVLEGILAEG